MFKAQKGSKDIVKNINGSTVILWSYKNTFCAQKLNNAQIMTLFMHQHDSKLKNTFIIIYLCTPVLLYVLN